MTGRYSSPDHLGPVGRTVPGVVVWARVPTLAVLQARYDLDAVPFVGRARARIGVALGRVLGRRGYETVAVPAASLGVGLAVQSLCRALAAGQIARGRPGERPSGGVEGAESLHADALVLDAVLEQWLPAPLPAVLARMPVAERVATVLRLLDGQPDGQSSVSADTPAAEDAKPRETDWLLEIARFAEGAGLSVHDALSTVPWRAFADEARRVEVLRAMRLSDAALAAAAGFNGGESAAAIKDALAAARRATGWRPEPASTDAVAASLSRLSRFFGVGAKPTASA